MTSREYTRLMAQGGERAVLAALGEETKPPVRRGTPEADLQADIVEALTLLGYRVEETTERRHRCARCGEWSHAGSGVTRGIGDLLIRRDGWRRGMKLNIELKTATGQLSPAQREALERGGIVVARSVEEAVALAREADNDL